MYIILVYDIQVERVSQRFVSTSANISIGSRTQFLKGQLTKAQTRAGQIRVSGTHRSLNTTLSSFISCVMLAG